MTKNDTCLLWAAINRYAGAYADREYLSEYASSKEEEEEGDKKYNDELICLVDKIGELTGWKPILTKENLALTEWEFERYEQAN